MFSTPFPSPHGPHGFQGGSGGPVLQEPSGGPADLALVTCRRAVEVRLMPTGLCLGGAGLGSEDTTTMATSAPWKRKEVRAETRRPLSFCKRVIQGQRQQETHMSLCCSREDLVPGAADTPISVPFGFRLGAHRACTFLSFQT